MPRHVLTALLWVSGTAAWPCGTAAANVAEHSQRAPVAGIDLITYRTDVKDVVVILGSLPAGDAMAGPGNIAVPTLAGMMLDRGTKSLDKFAIAGRLDDVGAEISFSVGTQSLEIRAKCLKKDLPLEARVKSYLHVNGSTCHVQEGGGNAKMELGFDTPLPEMRIVDVIPLHDRFGILDPKLVAPGAPERSVLFQRVSRRGVGQMPPLMSNELDHQAIDMIAEWIRSLPPETR